MIAEFVAATVVVYLWMRWVRSRRSRSFFVTLPDEAFEPRDIPVRSIKIED